MAHFNINFYSNSLVRPVDFQVIIPNDFRAEDPNAKNFDASKMKTIFLLHGYTGSAGNWIPEHFAYKYNFAIVMPSCENSFYLNGLSSAHKYQTFLGEELVDFVRKTFGLALRAEDTFIMGMSMGGFGALHTALAYPKTFGKCAGLSSALIVHGIAHMKEGDENPVANYHYYHECFGDLEKVEESDANPETLVKKLLASGEKLPDIYMCCGTEDFLLEPNRAMDKFLNDSKVPHVYTEKPGIHDMKYWDSCVPDILKWMFE